MYLMPLKHHFKNGHNDQSYAGFYHFLKKAERIRKRISKREEKEKRSRWEMEFGRRKASRENVGGDLKAGQPWGLDLSVILESAGIQEIFLSLT